MNVSFASLLAVICSCALLSSCITIKYADKEEPEGVYVAEDKNKDWQENYKDAVEKYNGKPGWNQAPPLPKPPAALPGTSYSRVKTGQPYIAMTFDDGPHPTNTPRLLDMLKQRNIRATFFVVGPNSKTYPHILRRMVAEGHEVANHTWTHGDMTKISQAAVRKELADSRDAIVAATGVAPKLWRPPYGAVNTNLKNWIKQEFGYPTIMWSVDPLDWKRPGPSVVADRLVSGTGNGGILLAHDIHKPTIDAMPSTFDRLLAKGYKFVTVSQLIALSSGTASTEAAEGETAIVASAIQPTELEVPTPVAEEVAE